MSQVPPSSEPPVEGIFPLELTWVLTPFPTTLSDKSLNQGLVYACMHSFVQTKKNPDGWMQATKPHPACTIHEDGMWLPLSSVFCVPGHARSSVRWVRRSPQSATVSQPVPKASCGPPPDWAMSGVSSHRRWGRIAGCGWGFGDPCRMDICLSGKDYLCGWIRKRSHRQNSHSKKWTPEILLGMQKKKVLIAELWQQ